MMALWNILVSTPTCHIWLSVSLPLFLLTQPLLLTSSPISISVISLHLTPAYHFSHRYCASHPHVCRMCEAPIWTRCQSQRKRVKRNWKACDYRKLQQAIRVNPLGQWLFFFFCLLVHAHCVWICNYKTSVQCEAICRPTTGCDSEL